VPGISPRQEENLREHAHLAERSYELAGLVENLRLDWDALRAPKMPAPDDTDKLREMGLGELARQLFPEKKTTTPRSAEEMFDDMWS
jgi:hypothetical protein